MEYDGLKKPGCWRSGRKGPLAFLSFFWQVIPNPVKKRVIPIPMKKCINFLMGIGMRDLPQPTDKLQDTIVVWISNYTVRAAFWQDKCNSNSH
jgi:hypothetical protein